MGSVLVVNAGSESVKLSVVGPDETATKLDSLEPAPDDVVAVAHRVVHGGPRFLEPVLIDDAVESELAGVAELAPLHNTPALAAIREARRLFPGLPHVAVFDTAFHATIPPEASTYPIPRRWREEWGIRRYGFHGIAVQSVADQVEAERLVVCHLGGGCSVTAVRDGRSIDTSMGFTPLDGIPMRTRSGALDPGVLIHVRRDKGLTVNELDDALEHESGNVAFGSLEDPLGFAVFTYRIAAAVAQMAMALGGLDLLAFSGGLGEHHEGVRTAVADRLGFLGEFRVEVVPAHEELVIAAGVREAAKGGPL